MTLQIAQVNLQRHFGGGEVFTAFLCRALAQLGRQTTLFVHRDARFWDRLALPEGTVRVAMDTPARIAKTFDASPTLLIGHGPLPAPLLAEGAANVLLTAIAHMPVQGRDPRAFAGHDRIFPVSGWVHDGLVTAGLPAWPEPLYGVADLSHRPAATGIARNSRYDWDRRKLRDRLLGIAEPFVTPLRRRPSFARRPGISLGIVSRITPIKQFPRLFEILVPIIARTPGVSLEIFGSGGYASVRDLDRVLRPLGDRARFWGQQADVRAVYGQLDYLLTGLPEKEALGLNVIEAQASDLPVLAVNAPPFTETVAPGLTGHLYRDPRQDQGADFASLLERLSTVASPLHPARATAHLARFSLAAFTERIARIVEWASIESGAKSHGS